MGFAWIRSRGLAWGLLLAAGAALGAEGREIRATDAEVRLRRTEPRYSEYAVSFPSPAQSPAPVNNTVYLDYFAPHGDFPVHPGVVVLHSLGATRTRVERSLCRSLAERGIAAALMALPYHLGRRPPGGRPADVVLHPEPERIVGFFQQAEADLQASVTWLQARPEIDPRRVGVVGISLGAVVASLQMARDERLRVNVSLLGGGDLAHILTHGAITFLARREYRRRGLDETTLRRALAPVEPLTSARPLTPPRRMLMINGRYDVIIPPSDVRKLWRAFGEPPLLWLDTGHYGPGLISDHLDHVIGDFLDAAFDDRPWHAPGVSALTLRLGLLTGYAPVLTPALFLDAVRFRSRPDLRLDAGLGSAGPLLMLDLGLRRGLDLTVGSYLFLGRLRPRAFLFWHVVL